VYAHSASDSCQPGRILRCGELQLKLINISNEQLALTEGQESTRREKQRERTEAKYTEEDNYRKQKNICFKNKLLQLKIIVQMLEKGKQNTQTKKDIML
jgi:hypothetical protein